MMPRDTDTSFVFEKGQLKTKERSTSVYKVSTDRLMAKERGYIILDNPVPIQK